MKVEMKDVPGKNPGIHISGPQVTPLVWFLFKYAMQANRIDCPWYAARNRAGAFYQGGSHSFEDEYVFIEFWKPETSEDFLHLINKALAFVDDNGQALDIGVNSGDVELLKYIKSAANFYEITTEENEHGLYIKFSKAADVNAMEDEYALFLTTIVEKSLRYPTDTFLPVTE